MKKLYFLALLGLTSLSSNSQTYAWSKVEGYYQYDYGMGIATDNAGNVYATGKYEQNGAVFSGNTITCVGNHDLWLAKYSPSGSLTWIRTAGGTLGDYAYGISVDANNVYAAGEIEGSGNLITFSGSTITLNAIGDNDILVAKWDQNGNLQWARREGGFGNEKAQGVSHDAAGNVYITGHYNATGTFGSSTTVNCAGVKDMFVAKYDANGNFQWVRTAGGPLRDEGKAIKCDAAGNVYVAGFFGNNTMFGSTTYTTYSSGYADGFLAKYDTNGNLLWVKTIAGNYDELAWSVVMDNAGFIYISGEFNDTGYFGSTQIYTNGNADCFVAKYDANGNCLWAKGAGGPLIDRARGIGTDGMSLFITGQFGGTANFGANSVVATDSSDVFFASLDNNGNFLKASAIGGVPDAIDPAGYESGSAITGDASGNVYATGNLFDGGVFGSANMSGYNHTDVFVTKLTSFVGINTVLNAPKAFYVYPNPGTGNFTLDMENMSNEKTDITIYNCLGQAVHKKTNNSTSKLNFDLSKEESGIYFLEIKNDDKVIANKKIIIQK